MLKVERVSKHYNYGQLIVLEGASVSFRPGEISALFGRNGSGKSTLFEILFGSVRADEFEATYNGDPYFPKKNISRGIIGYLPQNSFLPFHLLVEDVVSMMLQDSESVDRIFSAPGVQQVMGKRINNLSDGIRKYLEFLLVIHMPHPICLLDEPFSMVEPIYCEYIKEILRSKSKDKTVVISDHYYEDVLAISSQLLIISDLKIKTISDRSGLVKEGYLRRM